MATHLDRFRIGVAVAALMGAGAVAGLAQGTPEPGSMGALTAEVRELRLTIDRAGRVQSEVQALGVALSAQQSRLIQLSQRLDGIRRDLAEKDTQARQIDSVFGTLLGDPAKATAADRAEMSPMFDMFKQQAAQARDAAAQLRARELEVYQQLQQEEGRWNDLIARLEAATKR